MLKIVADAAIPFVERFFSCVGEVTLAETGQLNNDLLRDTSADVLVCRTATKIDQQLLHKSSIRIVASPSSGIDHIDLDHLQQRSIECLSAPGCNASSVAEYVLSALSVLADQRSFDLTKKSVGIIGCGNVGSRLLSFLQSLDIECMVYDPVLQGRSTNDNFSELADIQQADIISLHVPLTTTGFYPTREMLDTSFFQGLNKDVIFVNSSRGQVVDENALKAFLQSNEDAMAVIDVWANEPAIDVALLARANIATPHIAGYSIDAKLTATRTVFEQVCAIEKIDQHHDSLDAILPLEEGREIILNENGSDIDAVTMAALASYDVRSDAIALRRCLEDDVIERNSYFSELRNNYPIRREFSSLTIRLKKEAESLRQKLLALGFRVAEI